jgi:hypothetical protein
MVSCDPAADRLEMPDGYLRRYDMFGSWRGGKAPAQLWIGLSGLESLPSSTVQKNPITVDMFLSATYNPQIDILRQVATFPLTSRSLRLFPPLKQFIVEDN